LLPSAAAVLLLATPYYAVADEVALVAPGGIRCPVERLVPDFEKSTGHVVKATFGSGGATRARVMSGEPFDVSVVQPPHKDVLASGHVVASSEKPLATVTVVVGVRKGDPKPDLSSAEGVKKMFLAANGVTYPDWQGGKGSYTGLSVDETLKKLGIFEQVQPKIKRMQGVNAAQLLAKKEIDVALAFGSEMRSTEELEVVGPLPAEVSTPTGFIGFVGAHAKAPAAAQALLNHLSASGAAAAYQACVMQPSR
jgi:molybdate transport system substrate-binding protein